MSRKLRSFITFMLILLILVALIGLILHLTDDSSISNDVSYDTMYLSVNDEYVNEDKSGCYLSPNNPLNIEVFYPTDYSGNSSMYTYTFGVNTNVDFSFDVGYKRYYFAKDNYDFESCFNIMQTGNGIVIAPKGYTITELLKASVSNSSVDIHLDEESIDYSQDLFFITVISSDNSKSITIGLRFDFSLSSIGLDKKEIVF